MGFGFGFGLVVVVVVVVVVFWICGYCCSFVGCSAVGVSLGWISGVRDVRVRGVGFAIGFGFGDFGFSCKMGFGLGAGWLVVCISCGVGII